MKKEKKYIVQAERLKRAMDAKGMKKVELAALINVPKASITQYTNGDHWPDDNRKVGLMAKVLGVNPHWLMGFDGVPMQNEGHQADGNSQQSTYYTDPEVARIAEGMATNPELRALYDLQKDMDPEDLKAMYSMALALKRKVERTDSDDPA